MHVRYMLHEQTHHKAAARVSDEFIMCTRGHAQHASSAHYVSYQMQVEHKAGSSGLAKACSMFMQKWVAFGELAGYVRELCQA